MKALWILNSPIGTAATVLGYPGAASGTWISATAELLKDAIPELQINYAVLGYKDRTVVSEDEKTTVYELAVPQFRGRRSPKTHVAKWKRVLEVESPQLIHIWGTEFTNGLDVMDVCGDIPVAITLQGVVASLAKYAKSDVPFHELMKGHHLVAFPAYLRAKQREKMMIDHIQFECEMIRRSNTIFVGNEWEREYCRYYSENINMTHLPLCIDKIFLQRQWKMPERQEKKIFTIAPSTSMKGAHKVILALSVVVKKYPDVKLYLPGDLKITRYAAIKEPPYFRYLRRLIKDLGLEKNIVFCGKLTSEQMAEKMLEANVFVMPSKAENHSTTLREAMYLGCPCISSIVGCIPEFAVHNENILLYRYEEHEVLALEIIKLLSDRDFAAKLGKKGKEAINRIYPIDSELADAADWYLSQKGRE